MKTKTVLNLILRSLGVAGVLTLTVPPLAAEILTADTAVFVQTDAKSPIIARLKAGTEVMTLGEAPHGWRRVEVDGSCEAYVQNRDITKGGKMRPSSPSRPKAIKQKSLGCMESGPKLN